MIRIRNRVATRGILLHTSQQRVLRAAALVSLIAASGCSNMTSRSTSATAALSETQGHANQRYWQENATCWADVDAKYPTATEYYKKQVIDGLKDGRFSRKLSSDYLMRSEERNKCRSVYLDKTQGLLEPGYTDLNRTYLVEVGQQDRELANGQLSFVQYRLAHKALDSRLKGELEATRARTQDAARQRANEEAATAQQQAEVDADEQERTNAQTAAMMDMMAGMVNQPAFVSHGRPSRPVPSFNSVTPAFVPPSRPATPTPTSQSSIRYANECVTFGHRTDHSNLGMSVTNSCPAKVTVWTRDNRGIDMITIGPSASRNWTTIAAPLDYACYVEPGQQLCER